MDEGAPQAAAVRTPEEGALEPDEAIKSAVAALRHGWGEAYQIGWDAKRHWWARRRDGLGGDITAHDPDDLWQAILADYMLRPVPRPEPPGGDAQVPARPALRAVPGPHEITPKRGTAVSLRTGSPAVLTNMMSFPVEAECTECGGRVVCEQALPLGPDGGWRHEERPADGAAR